MPFESLSCQRCGSGDLQEVKPETYFCNHCDSVFKYVSPNRAGSAGGCEVLADRRPCGVQAIGRCRSCQRAFCGTHQARIGTGPEDCLTSEDRYSPGSAYPDWCAACRAAELHKSDDPDADKPALDQPFGGFLEERFFAREGRTATSVFTPEEKAVDDLIIEANRALNKYASEANSALPNSVREAYQLDGSHVFDCTAFASEGGERLTRVRRTNGTYFYVYDIPWRGRRSFGAYLSVWTAGRSRMLVAKCAQFPPVNYAGDDGHFPTRVRYTDIEEVGVFRMEAIAGSLKRYFPPPPLSEEKSSAEKAAKRRWFR
jgi:hypothetical protein